MACLAGTTFAALIFFGIHLGVAAPIPVSMRNVVAEAVPWVRSTLKWTRIVIKTFEAELRFGSCALHCFPIYDHFLEAAARRDLNPAEPQDVPGRPPPSPLPHFLLLQALSAAGASLEDSRFLLEILGFIFPRTFPPIFDHETQNRTESPEKEPSVVDAWKAAMQAVIVSVTGAPHPPNEPQYPWDWAQVRRADVAGGSVVPLESRRWVLVPLDDNSAARVMVERRGWWRMVRSMVSRWWFMLNDWMFPPDRSRGLYGVSHCFHEYLVEILWRWVEEGSRSLERRLRLAVDGQDVGGSVFSHSGSDSDESPSTNEKLQSTGNDPSDVTRNEDMKKTE